jgi:hypothetical protein
MNIFDYVQQRGSCKVACGWDFKLGYTILSEEEKYRIVGYVILPNGHQSMYRWTVDGEIENPAHNNGLNLVPCIPVTTYKSIDPEKLSGYNKIQDFIKAMLNEG